MFVEVFGDVGGLAEFAMDAKGADAMGDSSLRESVRDLRAHPTNDLMVFNGDDTATGFDGRADSVEIDPIDEGIVDDGRVDALGGQLFSSVDGFAEERAAPDQDDFVAWRQNFRF